MIMSGAMSRRKGARWERACRQYYQKHMRNYTHAGTAEPDITLTAGRTQFTVEVKNQNRLDLSEWWEQARASSAGTLPVIVHKRARRASVDDAWVTMTGLEFLEILTELDELYHHACTCEGGDGEA